MVVETYECEETQDETPEMSAEALRLVESLELEGQLELIASSTPGERIPYREMTKEETIVYQLLCPTTTHLEKYAKSPIPVRVLQVAAHAKETGMFDELVIWHANPAADPDPVLVAHVGKGYSVKTRFILARWGDVLDEWPALVNKALARYREQLTARLEEIQSKVVAQLARPATTDDMFNHGLPTYYER